MATEVDAIPVTPVTVILTAFDRADVLVDSLRRIAACTPKPAEVLVHVDAGRHDVADVARASGFADEVLVSQSRVGPGGGRNALMQRATQPLVASFDDDSWPLDADYFARLVDLFRRHPDAAVIGARLFHRGEPLEPAGNRVERRADFVGAGCAYRRDAFLSTHGYVPLPTAYNMEEVDLAIRLHAGGHQILFADALRVQHDTDLSHHNRPDITAASLANIALLAFLRYPIRYWGLGAVQYLNRLQWLLRHGRSSGVVTGILSTPSHLLRHRLHRRPLAASAIATYQRLKRGDPVSRSAVPSL
jgi:GT2 family glycosyltransferase